MRLEGEYTAFHLACQFGSAELADRYAKNNQNKSAIFIALVRQNKSLLELLVGPEKAVLPPLHLALEFNDFGLFKLLLKEPSKSIKDSIETPDTAGRTPLYTFVTKLPKEMKGSVFAVRSSNKIVARS